jgi:hypothetical protein
MQRSTVTTVAVLAAFTMTACDAVDEGGDTTTAEGALSAQTYSLWQPAVPAINFTGILFCYPGAFATDAKYATFRSATFDAARDWENATDGRLRLTPIGKCGKGIEVRMDKLDAGGSTKIGQDSEPIHVNRDYINDYAMIKDITLHELGHKLGFTHEQVHPDSTCPERQKDKFLFWEFETDTVGSSYFPYDPDSTMNYCQPRNIGLSAGDIDAVQRFYGGNEYLLSDGRTYWLRSGHGSFLGLGFQTSMTTRHKFTNVGRSGQDIHYGHQVTIQSDKGSYLYAGTSTNPKNGQVTVSVGYTDKPFVWDVGGFRTSGAVGVNDPVAFSVKSGNQRLFVGASKNIKNGMVTLAAGLVSSTSTTPPQEPGYIWRVLGPGPETKKVCDSSATRCGNTCCGNGNSCKDASISLCCGMFNERCGNVCCDLNSTCVSGVCRVQTPPPPPPPSSCGARPACATIADCPSAFHFCSAGCCGQIR